MYSRVFSIAVEPAGWGPNSTCALTCLKARSPSKAVVFVLSSFPAPAVGAGVFSTEGFDELAPSAQANMSAAMINSIGLRIADCGFDDAAIAFKKIIFCAGGAADISRWRNHRGVGTKTLPALKGRETTASVLRPSRARFPLASGPGGFSTG